jgi:phosphopantothenoylcysteine decarboxylase/phosphopantothenate--cysteine ligase
VIRSIGKKDLIHKKILIIGGATAEPVDDIRILTNRSSGKTAVALCMNAFERGADVELWYGSAVEPVPSFIPMKRFETVRDLFDLLNDKSLRRFDGVIVCAAIANYIPRKKKGKITSGKEKISIDCVPAPVVLKTLRLKAANASIIAFKAEEKKTTIERKSQEMVHKYRLDGVVGNTIKGFGRGSNEILLLKKSGNPLWKKGKKEELASSILDLLL